MGRLLKREGLFAPWREVPFSRYVLTVTLRATNVAYMMLCTYLGARAFGLELTALQMFGWLPAVFLANALPMNIAGFGAIQGAWVFAFSRYGISGAEILAFQIAFQTIQTFTLVARGLPFVRAAIRIHAAQTQGSPEEPDGGKDGLFP